MALNLLSPPPCKYLCFLSKKQEAACDFSNMPRMKSGGLNSSPCFGSAFHCQIHNDFELFKSNPTSADFSFSGLIHPKLFHFSWQRKEYTGENW